jgi:glycosyltransferase involved in cell wall biosynthesis
MSLLPDIKTSGLPDRVIRRSSARICMHVLGQVRNDMRVMREATALVEAGFAVSIIDVEAKSSHTVEEYIHGVCVKHIVSPAWFVSARFKPWFLVKFMLMIMRGIYFLVRSPVEVYHAQDQRALPACYIAALIRRKPLIFDAHELPLSDEGLKRWYRLHALSERFLAGMLPRCTGIITVSSPIAQEIRNRYRVSGVALVRNIPTFQVVPKSDRLRQHLGLSQDVRIALYQGGMQPNRGLDRLIRAAPFLGPDILIVMMGDSMKETQSQLEELIVSEKVAERVKILPPVLYEELLGWTASADIGLIVYAPDLSPNVRMCLPNKLFEYLMAGIPVLASKLDAVEEVIESYGVGQVVSSLDPADVGTAITAMLDDRITLDRMRRNALYAAQHEFCWEKEKQRLIQFYQTIPGSQDA